MELARHLRLLVAFIISLGQEQHFRYEVGDKLNELVEVHRWAPFLGVLRDDVEQ